MTVSEKQLQANRENARKGGVKTPEGKAIVKYNALKHGLLAKEAVIMVGDGAENQEEFNALLADLKAQLSPEGVLEEILVEKVAVAYWRLRRACKYEVGLIRNKLDTRIDNFYEGTNWEGRKYHKTDQEIDKDVEKQHEGIRYWKRDKADLERMHKDGKPLEGIYNWDENWNWLYEKVSELLPEDEFDGGMQEPKRIRQALNSRVVGKFRPQPLARVRR